MHKIFTAFPQEHDLGRSLFARRQSLDLSPQRWASLLERLKKSEIVPVITVQGRNSAMDAGIRIHLKASTRRAA